MTAAEQARAFERWQARMAAWAQSMWKAQAAEKRARQAHRERADVFDDPNASFAEVAAQSSWSGRPRQKIAFPRDVVKWKNDDR